MGSYSCFCYPGYTLATSGATQECQGKVSHLCPWEGHRTAQVVLGWKRIQAFTAPSDTAAECGEYGGRRNQDQGSNLDLGGSRPCAEAEFAETRWRNRNLKGSNIHQRSKEL